MKKITSVSYNLAAKFIAMIFFYLQDIVLARLLGIEGYAEWAYFFSIMSIIFWISNLGINNAIQVMVAKDGEDYGGRANHMISGLTLRVLVSGIFSILMLILGKPLCDNLGIDEAFVHLVPLMLWGSGYTFLYAFVEFWKSTTIGLKQTNKLFVMTLFEHAGHFVWSIIGFYVTQDVYGVIIGYIVAYGIASIVSVLLLKKEKIVSYFDSQGFKDNLHSVFKVACSYIIACLSAFVMLEMDTVMLGSMLSDKEELSLYVAAKKITSKAPNLNEAILTALMVEFAIINIGNISEKKKSFKKIFVLNVLCTCIVALLLIVFGDEAIYTLYGAEFKEAYKYLMVLLPSFLITAVNQMFIYFLYYQNEAGYVSATYFGSIVINLVLNTLFIPIWGATGAGIGTAIALIPFIILLMIKIRKYFKGYEKCGKNN